MENEIKQAMHFIYRISSSEIPGVYIGVTHNLARRWRGHRYSGIVSKLMEAIGEDSFSLEIIESVVGKAEAHKRERELIFENASSGIILWNRNKRDPHRTRNRRPRKPARAPSEEVLMEMRRLAFDGHCQKEISEAIGEPVQFIFRWCAEYEIKTLKGGRVPSSVRKDMWVWALEKSLGKTPESAYSAAKRFGITNQRMCQIVNECADNPEIISFCI